MNTKQGAQRLINYNCAKPAFCGFHLFFNQCVLIVCLPSCTVGAETAEWFFVGSPCCALGSQTLIYKQRGNYQHSLGNCIIHELCRICIQ